MSAKSFRRRARQSTFPLTFCERQGPSLPQLVLDLGLLLRTPREQFRGETRHPRWGQGWAHAMKRWRLPELFPGQHGRTLQGQVLRCRTSHLEDTQLTVSLCFPRLAPSRADVAPVLFERSTAGGGGGITRGGGMVSESALGYPAQVRAPLSRTSCTSERGRGPSKRSVQSKGQDRATAPSTCIQNVLSCSKKLQ